MATRCIRSLANCGRNRAFASQIHKGRIAATARLLAPARCFTPLSLSVSCRGSAVLLRCPDDGAPSAATARALLRTRRFATARASSGAVCARDPAPALIAASAWPFVRNRRADPPALAAALGDFSRELPLGDTRGEARGEAFFFLPSDAACLDARSLDLAPLSGGTRTGVIGVRERAGLLCQIDRWLGSVEIAAPNRCPTQRHRCQNDSPATRVVCGRVLTSRASTCCSSRLWHSAAPLCARAGSG